MCTLTCKWTYLAHERRWSRRFFERIGLAELLDKDCARSAARSSTRHDAGKA
jgi:D-ribulokinase